MFRAFVILLSMIASLVLGLGGTYFLAERGFEFGAVRSGPWVTNLRAANDPDPYVRAHSAKTGEIALALAEGISLKATVSDDGSPMLGNCSYVVEGNTPQSRFWTIFLETKDGASIDNEINRHGFTSSEILRGQDGRWSIYLNQTMMAGNWQPLTSSEPFGIILNLYEPTILGGTSSIQRDRLPYIKRIKCD